MTCAVCDQPITNDEWWSSLVWVTPAGSGCAHAVCLFEIEEAIRS